MAGLARGDTDWTDELIGKLRNLWDKGYSGAAIGDLLGVTKCAVIGKAHRLKLTSRPSPIRRDGSAMPVPRPKPVHVVPMLPVLASLTPPEPVAAVSVPIVVQRPVAKPYGRVVTCCWPLGEVKSKAFRFCDEPAFGGRQPYCEIHRSMGTVKAPRPGAQLGAD